MKTKTQMQNKLKTKTKMKIKMNFRFCDRKPKVPSTSPAASYVQGWALCGNRPANV